MATRLNIASLIDDLGGASEVAKLCDVVRTAPYGWVKRSYVSSSVLEKLKSANPDLDIDNYFNEVDDDQDETGRST